ncbi:MAG TPA: hypothetical protein DCD96_03985 [Flavobacteriales bacterium]|nr:hypothetical protein [Flavobacteriales bacterium]HRJ35718.1 S8 family serine peptidase [Flavobacteriales bacterium]HRJ39434.1 S8 family serine peptidase [Flavobacteriales bacterium]
MTRLLSSLLLLLLPFISVAQEKFWVFFTDKNGVDFDPYTFFDQKAIERRLLHGIDLCDESDFPVNTDYVAAVGELCDSLSYSSRWFNAVAVYGNEGQMELIRQLPFVQSVEAMDWYISNVTERRRIDLSDFNTGQVALVKGQVSRMQADKFTAAKIDGKGIRICVIDAGFAGFTTCEALRHTYNRDYVKDTYDFTRRDKSVYHGHSHGTMVVSCIAGKVDSIQLGLAPYAEFLLARTEKAFSDKLREEENWLAAVEWADKNGAQIINSSLGYTSSRYFRSQMNGKAGLISRAATIAAHKGILVVSSAGNEGDGAWKIVASPGDADSILTVGGINPWTGLHATWSSYGPSTDHRLKPNVSAFGHAIVGHGQGYAEQVGTSFASPLVAGFAACVFQMHPDWKNMKVLSEIESSSDLFPYYDYAHGYGVPQAGYFTDSVSTDTIPTFTIVEKEGKFSVQIDSSHYSLAEPIQGTYHRGMPGESKYEMESDWKQHHIPDQELSSSSSYVYTQVPDYVFYHIENRDGYVKQYFVISVHQTEVLEFLRSDFTKGEKLRIWYKGFMKTIEF